MQPTLCYRPVCELRKLSLKTAFLGLITIGCFIDRVNYSDVDTKSCRSHQVPIYMQRSVDCARQQNAYEVR